MKRVNIKCPYCGSRAHLRPAAVVHGDHTEDPTAKVYVCAHYPACDSYVAAHRATLHPMGTLANQALRRKRMEAHIAKFSELRCQQVIGLCRQFVRPHARAA